MCMLRHMMTYVLAVTVTLSQEPFSMFLASKISSMMFEFTVILLLNGTGYSKEILRQLGSQTES